MQAEQKAEHRCNYRLTEQHIYEYNNQSRVGRVQQQACAVKRHQVVRRAAGSTICHQANHCQRLIVTLDGGRLEYFQKKPLC